MDIIYEEKIFDKFTGQTTTFRHTCEVIEYVGKCSVWIKVIGTLHNGKPNATIRVRRWNVKKKQ